MISCQNEKYIHQSFCLRTIKKLPIFWKTMSKICLRKPTLKYGTKNYTIKIVELT